MKTIREQLEDIWKHRDCRDALRRLRWKEQEGVVVNNTIHYPVSEIKRPKRKKSK